MDPIYTLGLDEPPSWLVRPREARYDLDNIQLGVLSGEEQQCGVEVVYELDYLIVGGHARESSTNTPPRGVQLQLTAGHGKSIDDTLVVENLGYLQFKATPAYTSLRSARVPVARSSGWKVQGTKGGRAPLLTRLGMELQLRVSRV